MLRANCFNQTLASDATDTYINLTRPLKTPNEHSAEMLHLSCGGQEEPVHLMDVRWRRLDHFYIILIVVVIWDACKYLRCVLHWLHVLWQDRALMIDGWDGLIFKGQRASRKGGE